jgi:hypothetical protein
MKYLISLIAIPVLFFALSSPTQAECVRREIVRVVTTPVTVFQRYPIRTSFAVRKSIRRTLNTDRCKIHRIRRTTATAPIGVTLIIM